MFPASVLSAPHSLPVRSHPIPPGDIEVMTHLFTHTLSRPFPYLLDPSKRAAGKRYLMNIHFLRIVVVVVVVERERILRDHATE